MGVFYNIFATAGAIDFKFGAQLVFAKAHHKFTRHAENRVGMALGCELPKILWFHFNIYTMAEAMDSKFGT